MSKRISDAEENAILGKLENTDPDVMDDTLAEISEALDDAEASPREQVVETVNALARLGLRVS